MAEWLLLLLLPLLLLLAAGTCTSVNTLNSLCRWYWLFE
jgi:hypothetical protein